MAGDRNRRAVGAILSAEEQIALVDRLLAKQESAIQSAFIDFLDAMQSTPVVDEVVGLLEQRKFEEAMSIVDSYVAQMGNVLPKVAVSVGEATAQVLDPMVAESSIAISFDPSHPRAAEAIRANRLRFVTDFSEQQRATVLQALDRAYRQGLGTVNAARAFRESIGLTPYQEQVVENYRQALLSRNRNALTRALRDRRYDKTVDRAVRDGTPLRDDQVERMVAGYRRRMIAARADTIARTEGVRATAEASMEAKAQMIERTGIDPSRVDDFWNPTEDARTRDWHASMAGQKRGPNGVFHDGLGNILRYPGDPDAPAETVINCRCALTFSVAPPA